MQTELVLTPEQGDRIARIYIVGSLTTVLVAVLYWFGYRWFGIRLSWSAAGIGALGWLIALVLRAPVSLAVRHQPKELMELVVGLSSGPLEEGMRVIALLWAGRNFDTAMSIGFGWAMIEVLYTIQIGIVIAGLVKKTDPKARQALAVLKERGMLTETPNAWGAVERIFASAIHIGNSLLVAFNPLLAVVTAPVHSAINWWLTRLARRSIATAELMIAFAGTVILLAGLLAFGRV